MSENLDQKATKKRRPSFVYAILSITMVLLMSGILALLVFYTQKAITKVRESIELEVILNTDSRDIQVVELRNYLSGQPWILSQEFITKEEAAKNYAREIGQDFVDALGYNPLYDAFIIRLNAKYSNFDSIDVIQSGLLRQPAVQGGVVLPCCRGTGERTTKECVPCSDGRCCSPACPCLFPDRQHNTTADVLATVHYSQYAVDRGHQGFYHQALYDPGIFTGTVSGIITIIVIGLLLLYIENRFHIGLESKDALILSGIALGIIAAGVLISTISTYFAVSKYLRMKLDDLY